MTESSYLPMGDYAEVEIDRPIKATNWMSGEEFFVGDIVSRDGSDLHRVIEIVTEDLIVVECIREPEGSFIQALFNAWLATAIRPCICCSEPFISTGTHNVVCSSCRASAPEF